MGYSWGRKELDTTEQLHFIHTGTCIHIADSLHCTAETNITL